MGFGELFLYLIGAAVVATIVTMAIPFPEDTPTRVKEQERLNRLLKIGGLHVHGNAVKCDQCGDGCGQCSNERVWTDAQSIVDKAN